MEAGETYKYVAFYDLDHTVLEDNSATHLVHTAKDKGIMSEKHFRQAVWLSILYKLRIGDSSKMIERMLSWIRGMKVKEMVDFCQEIFDQNIVKRIRPLITESFADHRKAGGAVVLLTSASEPVAGPVSRHLELDDLICTDLEVDNGIYTGKTLGSLVYGKEKEVRMLAWCRQHGFDPQDAYYYGDSFTDRHVMNAVGYPVAVDPDSRLLKIAKEKDWMILVRERT